MQALLLLDACSINNNLCLESYSLSEFIRHLYIFMHLNLPKSWKFLKTHMKYAVSTAVVCSFVQHMWGKRYTILRKACENHEQELQCLLI